MSVATVPLAEQQNQLLAQLFSPQLEAPSRGMATYRANAHANSRRALDAAYPTIAQLLGEENFAFLARDFLREHPPQCGDLGQWGGQLAEFLAQAPQLTDMPYLADVAQIEWALHACADAPDQAQNLASFPALAQHDPSMLRLKLAPAACALRSAYPAASIVIAHQEEAKEGAAGSVQAAFDLLRRGVAQTALVWRQGFAPRLRVLHANEQTFFYALLSEQTLAESLNAASDDFDFGVWLSSSVQNGLLLGVSVSDPFANHLAES